MVKITFGWIMTFAGAVTFWVNSQLSVSVQSPFAGGVHGSTSCCGTTKVMLPEVLLVTSPLFTKFPVMVSVTSCRRPFRTTELDLISTFPLMVMSPFINAGASKMTFCQLTVRAEILFLRFLKRLFFRRLVKFLQ